MRLLRKILRDSIPELADALERSWTIALDEWLAAIAPNQDSFNAYPHLRNHEKHLERIWLAYEAHHGTAARPLLSPIELYVMLSSILFHDIGRTRTSKNHGEASEVIIRENHAALGIPSNALAEVIAPICRFHDLPASKMPDELKKLSTTSIDPYGEIRQSACAALLTLIDYMDGTVTRVAPDYIRDSADMAPVGAFRRVIRDVEIDFEGQLVKIVLGDVFDPGKREAEDLSGWTMAPDFKRYETSQLVKLGSPKKGTLPSLIDLTKISGRSVPVPANKSKPLKWTHHGDETNFLDSNTEESSGLFYQITRRAPRTDETLVARQYAQCSPKDEKDRPLIGQLGSKQRARVEAIVGNNCLREWLRDTRGMSQGFWEKVIIAELTSRSKEMARAARKPSRRPKGLLLATILGNCRENAEVLRQIRQTLWTVGVPVRAWLVEWKEHLFNEYGQETREPILVPDDLERTLDAMVSLTTRGLRSVGFRYDTLAAEVREIDVCKTKRAVHRIGIVWRKERTAKRKEEHSTPTVLVGQTEWRLISQDPDRAAWLHRANELKRRQLKRLSNPDAGGPDGR